MHEGIAAPALKASDGTRVALQSVKASGKKKMSTPTVRSSFRVAFGGNDERGLNQDDCLFPGA